MEEEDQVTLLIIGVIEEVNKEDIMQDLHPHSVSCPQNRATSRYIAYGQVCNVQSVRNRCG